ncbi:ABC transporter permease [Niabella sp. CC-SYL272]|uniref:ABC transporter permease/M1 family aminopeptidase n=1 Tax=Niabella agricola TaxID=2891571 RepID=UPI001F31AB5F|nr:ABC transporter permease [Niabella agricola]MCF3110160.1 ABC transporter permease [Niabella agricola]
MFRRLIHFEWLFISRKRSFYLLLLFFILLGLAAGTVARFPFPNAFKNGTYVLNYIIGILSLLCIFSTTILTAQTLFREKDSRFESILYATPVRKGPYVCSRFGIVFLVSALCYLLLIAGMMAGHRMPGRYPGELDAILPLRYLQPFFMLLLPNILFCTAVAVSIGLFTRNKMLVYVFGILVYFLYWGISFYANAPIIANSTPMPASAMRMAALADPFGISAFLEQTRYWSALQRNTQLLQLNGHLLINRLLYLAVSGLLLLLAYKKFVLQPQQEGSPQRKRPLSVVPHTAYHPVITRTASWRYHLQCLQSLVSIGWNNIIKSIPIWLILAGWVGFMSIETFSDINGNSRMPEHLTTTAVLVKSILSGLPIVALLALVFYGNELFWRSHNTRFDALENTTAVRPVVLLVSKWLSLLPIVLLLLLAGIGMGLLIQLIKQNAPIDWALYASLFYLIGLPLFLNAGLIICIQALIKNKYAGIVVAGLVVLLTNTSMGNLFGLKHPLLRFANTFQGAYSEMNGFDNTLTAFHYQMLYWSCITLLLFMITTAFRRGAVSSHRASWVWKICILGVLSGAAIYAGATIFSNTPFMNRQALTDWKISYEKKYAFIANRPQPEITDVSAAIDLYPDKAGYEVQGRYRMVNQTHFPIDTLYMYGDKEMRWKQWQVNNGKCIAADSLYGYYTFKLHQPLMPNDSMSLQFSFEYQGNPFKPAAGFNTITRNGSFIRVSRYFPVPGYNNSNEIEDKQVRKKYGLDTADRLTSLSSPREQDAGFVHFEAVVSVDDNQTAISIGELTGQWKKGSRNYYRYKTPVSVPFRFAVASARYAVKKKRQGNTIVEVYYTPEHSRNIGHLMNTARQSIAYCATNIGPYPFSTARFVEISALTKGFAGTAYPGSLFINEGFGYRNVIDQDPAKDIINEMVSHETAHTWWGNSGIAPDEREGSTLMTETLAMYTELMCYKKVYGTGVLANRVGVHKDLYLSSRNQSDEPPLFRLNPAQSYLSYDKGMVIMYQLYLRLGEARINSALKSFYQQHAYPQPAPVATDLLQALYAVATPSDTTKLDEWFRQVVTYDLVLKSAIVSRQANNTYILKLDAAVTKYKEDGKGNETAIPFNEPVDLLICFSGGKTEKRVLQPVGNRIQTTLSFSQKPLRVVLDPDLKFLNRSDETKEKTITTR